MLGVRSMGRQTVVTCLESDPGGLNRACFSQGRLYLTPQAACCYLFSFGGGRSYGLLNLYSEVMCLWSLKENLTRA